MTDQVCLLILLILYPILIISYNNAKTDFLRVFRQNKSSTFVCFVELCCINGYTDILLTCA